MLVYTEGDFGKDDFAKKRELSRFEIRMLFRQFACLFTFRGVI